MGQYISNTTSDEDNSLPFQQDLKGYFQQKFHDLKPGERWRLSLPVRRFHHTPAPLAGQINFFREKNIMFLLEQHGFHMVWRRNRFSTTLDIIARRN